MAGAAIALAMQLQVGDLVTVGTEDAARCGRISYVDANPTGVAWYWLELEQPAEPRTVLRVRLEQLQQGCSAAVAGGGAKSGPQ
jgi:hypothetical protein